MNKAKLILVIAMASILSCSSDSSSGNPIKKAKISGVSQKGPFMEGSKATLYELNDRFELTGRSFPDRIADSRGSFEIRNVELVSPYAMLEADGYYRNENTGGESGPIKLFAIADLREKDQINVNVLTHLEYYRVLNLVENGSKTIAAAKKQAQKEIFAVFGIDSDGFKDSEDMSIFGTSESDAALLAISVLLQGDLSEAEFSSRLMDFSQAIKNGGTWNNEAAKTAMAEWAAGWAIASNTGANPYSHYSFIREQILGWKLASEVPYFERYVYDYWVKNFEIGECNIETDGFLRYNFVCKNNFWTNADNVDIYCFESETCEIFTDPRDGNKYRTEIRGSLNQTWMLNPLTYVGVDGNLGIDRIEKVGDNSYTDHGSFVYPSLENALIACPSGWRLPSDDEIIAFSCGITRSYYLVRLWSDTGKRLIWDCEVENRSDLNPNHFDPAPYPIHCVKN